MAEQRDGGPAFPAETTDRGWVENHDGVNVAHIPCEGMSLLDWFAGQALVGLLAYNGLGEKQVEAGEAAKDAFEYADAMLAERSRRADE